MELNVNSIEVARAGSKFIVKKNDEFGVDLVDVCDTWEEVAVGQGWILPTVRSEVSMPTANQMREWIRIFGVEGKIQCLKQIRYDTNCRLKEAKDMCDIFIDPNVDVS